MLCLRSTKPPVQLPSPPPVPGMGRGGQLYPQPPNDDLNDPATKRWHWRQATHRAAIAEVHALADQGLGQRAIARQTGHHTANEQMLVTSLLEKPFCASLRTVRSFLVDWYRLCVDENQQRRPAAEAQSYYEAWRTNATYAAIPALKRIQDRLTPARFESLSQFLHHPDWEATNNGAERAGRAFRHRQAPHFNLRKDASIERTIVVTACMGKKTVTTQPRWQVCQRGRRNRQATEVGSLLTLNQVRRVLAT